MASLVERETHVIFILVISAFLLSILKITVEQLLIDDMAIAASATIEISRLRVESDSLRQELLTRQSLWFIASEAAKLGMEESKRIHVLY